MMAWVLLVAVVGADVESFRRQLELNPALANDPAFRAAFEQAYRSQPDRGAQTPALPTDDAMPSRDDDRGVRAHRMLGAALSYGAQDLLSVGATVFFFQHLQITAAFGAFTPSFNGDVRFIMFEWALSPYVGMGIHVPFTRGVLSSPWADLWKATYLWGEIGGQYVSDFGLFAQLGLQLVPRADSRPGKPDWPNLMPTVTVGWLADL